MTKAKLTIPVLAKNAGVGESWVKQVRRGSIDKPRPEWLRAIAAELGLEERKLLALSDQLGAVTRTETPSEDPLLGYLARITVALEKLAGISPDDDPQQVSPGASTALRELSVQDQVPSEQPERRTQEVSG